jgi:ferritin-like metal-binding protein YciE
MTENQIKRLEQVFQYMNEKPSRKACKAMHGLVEEGDEKIKEHADSDVKDAALIAAAQKVEHYEISAYGTARTYAQMMGHDQVAMLLQQTLEEESRTDEMLTRLAENNINLKAMM